MDLTPYTDRLRHELLVAAEAGGDDARLVAERLVAPLDSAVRLVLLEALAEAADEITRDLAPGSVEVRFRGRAPGFVVTSPPVDVAEPEPVPAEPVDIDVDGATTRINLRLPDTVKERVEEAAGRARLSVNAWLVRAAVAGLAPAPERPAERSPLGRQGFTGWVR